MKFVPGSKLTLSSTLQTVTNDLSSACKLIKDNKRVFDHVLEDNEKKTYHDIYREACKIANENFVMLSTRNLCSNPIELIFRFIFIKMYFDHL